jgi:PAS domain S-box-containing protein
MNVSIRTKLLVLCIVLVLVTIAGISAPYYILTRKDKQRESRQRIQIAFDIILNDFEKRVNTYTASVNKFLQENITLLWATYTYSLDDSEEGTILFLFDHFNEVSAELKQFGRVALADRVMLYGANKRLLVVYQRLGDQETRGGYLVSDKEGSRYLPMNDLSIQAEITFRRNNLAINAINKPLPEMPLPPGVRANYEGEIPDIIAINLFREGQQLGIRIVAPIYRREEKMGILVGEVLYTQEMVEEYALLSKTEVSFFAENQLSVGTMRDQTQLETEALEQTVLCQDILNNHKTIDVSPVTLGKQDYYQGQCTFRNAQDMVGAITVSLSQDIEKREVGKIVQTVFTISGIGIVICIGLVSWIFVPKFTAPIIKLTNAALRMAQGDLGQNIDTSGTDELGTLARSFAYMRNEIQQKIEELQQLNAELDQRVEERTAEVVRQKYILDTFMATVPDRIYFKDREGQITRANLAHARRVGLSNPSEEAGKTDFDFFPEEDARRRYEQEQEIIRTGIPLIGVEERRERSDGMEEWSLVTKMPLRDEHEEIIGTFGISRDITTLKQTEETLKHAKEAAEAANRAKSEFLANMNHELRTPLNVILGLTQTMTRNPLIPAEERENLEIIYRSGEHLLTLINNVLDLSKIEAGRVVLQENNINLFRLLDELEEMFSLKAAQKRLHLVFERTDDVPKYVCTDATKLRQVLMNLLNNAVKFTEEGGIVVRVSCLNGERGRKGDREKGSWGEREIRETSSQLPISPSPHLPISPSPQLHFEVEDTGPGIAPDEMDSLFEAFGQTQTGRRAQEGTGLGLTISQKFVQLMRGEISVHTELGRGTTFAFTIPVKVVGSTDVTMSPLRRRVIALQPGQPRYRLLIVDDKPDNRRLLVKLFTPFGFDIREAANGQEAISMWNTFEPHLIWMDMRMPVLDGYKATKHIKSEIRNSKSKIQTVIVALTASSTEEEREVVLAAGCDDFLRKPFRDAEIFEIMHKHLGLQYVYEKGEDQEGKGERQAVEEILTPAVLTALPADIYTELQQAVNVTDPGKVNYLVTRIRDYNSPLADTLTELMKQFRFDILQAVFEEMQL